MNFSSRIVTLGKKALQHHTVQTKVQKYAPVLSKYVTPKASQNRNQYAANNQFGNSQPVYGAGGANVESVVPIVRVDVHRGIIEEPREKWDVVFRNLNITLVNMMYPDLSYAPRLDFINIYVREFSGVAYTKKVGTGAETHISANHLLRFPHESRYRELLGVAIHELTHAWQYNGHNTAPAGLIEGIADYYRYKAGYIPAHWRADAPCQKWDSGYEKTAFFLLYVEEQTRMYDFVARLNVYLRNYTWNKNVPRNELGTGRTFEEWFEMYKGSRLCG